jgi:hypothetical protein
VLAFGMIRAAIAAVVLCLLTPAAAQEGAAPPEASDIIVVGRTTEEAVRAFVGEMSAPSRGADQLARWDRRVCPGVAGLRARYARPLIDRLAQRAHDVDLDVGEPGCRPNILIVVSTDPDAVARDLYDNHRRALGYFDNPGAATRGRDALRATFLNSDAPVRWWHVSNAASATGQQIERRSIMPCRGSDVLDLMHCYPANAMGGVSRLRATTRQDFGGAFIIVDANRLSEIGFDFNALADYLAMVSLAQLDPAADVSSYPSVLNLWRADDEAAHVLTDWDLAYLRGLYSSTREAASVRRHESDIARDMMRGQEQQN